MPEYLTDKQQEEIKAASGFSAAKDPDIKLNRDAFRDYRSARAERYKDQVENDNFYHNVHFDKEQRAEIISRGQAPLEINVTYSIIKQMISLLTSESPVWDVDPVGDTDKKYAYLMRSLLDASWYNSKAGRQLSQITKNKLITGIGYASINPMFTSSGSAFGVQFKHLPYHHVYVSPNAREFDFSDAENIVISKMMSHEQIADLFGIKLEEVEKIAAEDEQNNADSTGSDKSEPTVRYMSNLPGHKRSRVIQRLSMSRQDIWIVTPVSANASVSNRKVYFSETEQIRRAVANNQLRVQKVSGKVLEKCISVGQYGHKYYMPIGMYNVVPFIDEFNDNPYPLGEVDFLMPLQKALNKFIMLTILNATLANNMKTMSPTGAIDKTKYENSYALPGVLIEYDWKEGMPEPKQINPQAFTEGFFQFPKFIISLMEYLTGIFGVIQGNPEGAPRTASGLMSLQNYGGQKIRLLGRNMNDALSSCGDVAIELFQNYAPYNQTMAYYDEQKAEMRSVQFNTQIPKEGNVTIDNDLSIGKFKTRCIVRQNYGSERELKANMLANLAAQTKSQALLKPILKLADIPEVDEVLDSIDEIASLNQTVQQQQQTIERITQINQQLENAVMRKSQQVTLSEFEGELRKLFLETKTELAGAVMDEITKIRESLSQLQPSNNGAQ